jgi:hypothetical protein
MNEHDRTLERLDDQIALCDRRSEIARQRLKWLKGVQLLTAVAIAAVARLGARRRAIAALGALICVIEGAQHLTRYEQTWISSRATCEALKHEKFLFLTRAGPYEGVSDALRLLAERIEGLIAAEHTSWISATHEPSGSLGDGRDRARQARGQQPGAAPRGPSTIERPPAPRHPG